MRECDLEGVDGQLGEECVRCCWREKELGFQGQPGGGFKEGKRQGGGGWPVEATAVTPCACSSLYVQWRKRQ